MNILALCDRYPSFPYDGLTLRMAHIARELKKRHTVDLVCYDDQKPSRDIEPLFRHITTFSRPVEVRASGLQRLKDAISSHMLYTRSAEASLYIHDVVEKREYDLIADFGGNMLMNMPDNLRGITLVVDNIDDSVLTLWREVRTARNPWDAAILLKRLLLTASFERTYLGRADFCSFVSEEDAAVFSRLSPRTAAGVIQNGVDSAYFKPQGAVRQAAEIVFEGTMSFPPNIDAVLYFVSRILPSVIREIPETHFTIAGMNPAEPVRKLASEHVEITGSVEDVRPYLDRASVFVCPMRKGAGIKNKILQAWAMEKAVVATSASIGGLHARDGENILIRDDPKEFAEAVVGLLRDPGEARRIGTEGRKTVLEHFDWKAKACEMEAVMKRVIQGKAHA